MSEPNIYSELVLETDGHRHSICVGNKCAWCMDCGKIVIWYDKKEYFKRLMNPFGISDD